MKLLLSAFAALLFGAISAMAAGGGETTAQFDAKSGLFVVRHHTVKAVSAQFVFWSGEWVWINNRIKSEPVGPLAYRFLGGNKEAAFGLDGVVDSPARNQLRWRIDVKPGDGQFGGIDFKFNLAAFESETQKPVQKLLPGKNGWELSFPGNAAPIRLVIDPPPLELGFVRGNKNELRASFAGKGQELALGTYTMVLSLPEGIEVSSTAAERLAAPDGSWNENVLGSNGSPVDLSFLNEPERPAGKRGRLGAKEGAFVFADGTKPRFWGTNLTAYALLQTSLDDTVQQSKRLSRLGFNLVRFHHFDSDWVKPNILGAGTDGGFKLDKESLRRLDWWIKALGDEGIYVWLDLNVGRVISADGVEFKDELVAAKNNPTAKGFAYVNPEIERKMLEFNRLILDHVNPYTKLAYRDDPRIAFLLVTNENDMTHHFGNMFLPNSMRPGHSGVFMAAAKEFAEERGLDPQKVWQTWLFGPSKLFLNELEHLFNERMLSDIRSKPSGALVATTNSWGRMTAVGLPSLADGDMIDVHSYEDDAFLEADPKYRDNFVGWVAAAGLAGKPVSVSEWNAGDFPAPDRSSMPGYMAAIASLQDWNAVTQYAYSVAQLGKPRPVAQWAAVNDPALLGMMPAGALLYRQAHAKPGEDVRHVRPSADQFIDSSLSPATSRAIRTLTESGRWRMALPPIAELPWFKPPAPPDGSIAVSDLQADFSGGGETVCAETLDFCRNWRRGTFVVDTDLTQLASGWIGGETISLKHSVISLKTANAALAIQSLDSAPIPLSRSIMVSMAAQTVPGPKDGFPLSEPVVGRISVRAAPGLEAFAAFGDGLQKPIKASYEDGFYVIDIDSKLGTYWIVLKDG